MACLSDAGTGRSTSDGLHGVKGLLIGYSSSGLALRRQSLLKVILSTAGWFGKVEG